MKNKILFTLVVCAVASFGIGASLGESEGFWHKVSLVMMVLPVIYGALFLYANRGRL